MQVWLSRMKLNGNRVKRRNSFANCYVELSEPTARTKKKQK